MVVSILVLPGLQPRVIYVYVYSCICIDMYTHCIPGPELTISQLYPQCWMVKLC